MAIIQEIASENSTNDTTEFVTQSSRISREIPAPSAQDSKPATSSKNLEEDKDVAPENEKDPAPTQGQDSKQPEPEINAQASPGAEDRNIEDLGSSKLSKLLDSLTLNTVLDRQAEWDSVSSEYCLSILSKSFIDIISEKSNKEHHLYITDYGHGVIDTLLTKYAPQGKLGHANYPEKAAILRDIAVLSKDAPQDIGLDIVSLSESQIDTLVDGLRQDYGNDFIKLVTKVRCGESESAEPLFTCLINIDFQMFFKKCLPDTVEYLADLADSKKTSLIHRLQIKSGTFPTFGQDCKMKVRFGTEESIVFDFSNQEEVERYHKSDLEALSFDVEILDELTGRETIEDVTPKLCSIMRDDNPILEVVSMAINTSNSPMFKAIKSKFSDTHTTALRQEFSKVVDFLLEGGELSVKEVRNIPLNDIFQLWLGGISEAQRAEIKNQVLVSCGKIAKPQIEEATPSESIKQEEVVESAETEAERSKQQDAVELDSTESDPSSHNIECCPSYIATLEKIVGNEARQWGGGEIANGNDEYVLSNIRFPHEGIASSNPDNIAICTKDPKFGFQPDLDRKSNLLDPLSQEIKIPEAESKSETELGGSAILRMVRETMPIGPEDRGSSLEELQSRHEEYRQARDVVPGKILGTTSTQLSVDGMIDLLRKVRSEPGFNKNRKYSRVEFFSPDLCEEPEQKSRKSHVKKKGETSKAKYISEVVLVGR